MDMPRFWLAKTWPTILTGIVWPFRVIVTVSPTAVPVRQRNRPVHQHQHATAKSHVAHLLAKLVARDRVQLVIMAYEAGLVSPSR